MILLPVGALTLALSADILSNGRRIEQPTEEVHQIWKFIILKSNEC